MSHKTRFLCTLMMTALLPHVAHAALAGATNQGFQSSGQFTGGDSSGDAASGGANVGASGAHAPSTSQVAQATGGGGSGSGSGSKSSSGGGAISSNTNAVSAILHPDTSAKAAQAAIDNAPPVPMDNDEVRDIVMDMSINGYHGYCACPYSKNSDGFECGVEAAYYKPGGYRIYCYPEDVRKQLNIFYRKTH